MNKLIFIFSLLLFSTSVIAQTEVTRYFLIRHAEKNETHSTDKNPKLSDAGLQRVETWKSIFSHITFDAVYSTKYNRTMETATPIAAKNNLELQYYDARKLNTAQFQKDTKGKTVLIVGHSNTTPFFANKILKEEKFEQITENNYANLYIITVTKETRTSVLLQID